MHPKRDWKFFSWRNYDYSLSYSMHPKRDWKFDKIIINCYRMIVIRMHPKRDWKLNRIYERNRSLPHDASKKGLKGKIKYSGGLCVKQLAMHPKRDWKYKRCKISLNVRNLMHPKRDWKLLFPVATDPEGSLMHPKRDWKRKCRHLHVGLLVDASKKGLKDRVVNYPRPWTVERCIQKGIERRA